MGCCETRDEKKQPSKVVKQKISRGPYRDFNLNQMRDQDKVVVTESNSKDTDAPLSNANSLRLYVEWCKNMKKWDELSILIGDQTELSDVTLSFQWASTPKSVGSLAALYLSIECQKSPMVIAPYINSVLLEMIKAIKNGSEDFQENSAFLLYFFLDSATENAISRMVKFNVFGVISKFLLGKKLELRFLTAAICAKIYRGRAYAQEEFLNHNGGFKLVQLIASSVKEPDEILIELVGSLADLIQDGEKQVVPGNAKRINESAVWEILDSIDKEKASADLLEKIDELICLLKS